MEKQELLPWFVIGQIQIALKMCDYFLIFAFNRNR